MIFSRIFASSEDDDSLLIGAAAALSTTLPAPNSVGSGARVGDLAVVIGGGVISSGSGGDWITVSGLGGYRELNSGDLGSTISTTGNRPTLIILRGPKELVSVAFQGATTLGVNICPGITRHANHMGFLAFTYIQNGTATIDSISGPTGFLPVVNRSAADTKYWSVFAMLYPDSPPYVSGTGFTWTANGSAGGAPDTLFVLELRRA